MGEVYRARDPRLGRDVAVKVLPEALRTDPDRMRRFEQEARAASALNHPNLLVVLDVGTHDGIPYVVSELLEGQTLRERLRTGGLTPAKAVECAVQIALGLSAAHEKGITHRDLKPENLFLTRDGRVKILDFGLAKLREPVTGGGSEVPTLSQGTEPGAILGTVGYMSPEQVRGMAADHRSDIFSFGAVLYEMLAKRRAFAGESSPEVLTAILKEDPPELGSSERNLSPALGRIVRRCLEKRPEDRFHSAHDLALALEALAGERRDESKATPAARPRPLVVAAIALAASTLAATIAYVSGKHPGYPPPVFHRLTFRRGPVFQGRFTRDGGSVVYGAKWEDSLHHELYLQRLDSSEPRSLDMPDVYLQAVGPNELAVHEKASPMRIVGTLSRVPLEGGGLRKVLGDVAWADWSPDGTTLAVSRSGAGREWIEFPIGKTVWESTVGHVIQVRVSPDGKRVAFMEQVKPPMFNTDIAVVDESGRKTTLSRGWYEPFDSIAWSPDGKEVWFAAPRAGELASLHAVSLGGQERLVLSTGDELRLLDISKDGRVLLVAREGRHELRGAPDGIHERSFSWLDESSVGDLSADGKTLLFNEQSVAMGPVSAALFLRGLADPAPTRLGDGAALGLSPDGAWALAYEEGPTGLGQLSLVPTGVGATRTLARGNLENIEAAGCWFPDGRRIVVVGNEHGRPPRLFVQEVPDGLPRALTPEGATLDVGYQNLVSPDGRLVAALLVNEQPSKYALFPTDGGAAIPIPGIGGDDVPLRWSGNGRFLFVLEEDGLPPARIDRLDLRTGRRQRWKEFQPPDMAGVFNVHNVVLGPDGGAYFYDYYRALGRLCVVDGLR